MTKPELQNRFNTLTDILRFSQNLGYFTAGQRTCIHQERAALLQAMERLNYSATEASSPKYQVPDHIETKINRVVNDFK